MSLTWNYVWSFISKNVTWQYISYLINTTRAIKIVKDKHLVKRVISLDITFRQNQWKSQLNARFKMMRNKVTCNTLFCRASLFCASRSAMEGWFVNLCGWSRPPFFWLHALHTSKSGQISHRQPWPVSISWWQTLHVVTKAGAVGLWRWYKTIIEECFARRRVSYW